MSLGNLLGKHEPERYSPMKLHKDHRRNSNHGVVYVATYP